MVASQCGQARAAKLAVPGLCVHGLNCAQIASPVSVVIARGLRRGKGEEDRKKICAKTRRRCGVEVPLVGLRSMSCVSIVVSVISLH